MLKYIWLLTSELSSISFLVAYLLIFLSIGIFSKSMFESTTRYLGFFLIIGLVLPALSYSKTYKFLPSPRKSAWFLAALWLGIEMLTRLEFVPPLSIEIPLSQYISSLLIAPLVEEILGKHLFIGGAVRLGVPPLLAVLAHALTFQVLHVIMLYDYTIGHFFFALVSGIMYIRGVTLLVCILYHGIANFLILLSGFIWFPYWDFHIVYLTVLSIWFLLFMVFLIVSFINKDGWKSLPNQIEQISRIQRQDL